MAEMGPAFAGTTDFVRRPVIGARIDFAAGRPYVPALRRGPAPMKIANSLKSLKKRDKNCRVVRRKGRVYVINKTNPRFKARQG